MYLQFTNTVQIWKNTHFKNNTSFKTLIDVLERRVIIIIIKKKQKKKRRNIFVRLIPSSFYRFQLSKTKNTSKQNITMSHEADFILNMRRYIYIYL